MRQKQETHAQPHPPTQIIYLGQVGFISEMQDWFNKYMSPNILNHINDLKNYMIISTDTKKAFDKNPT